MKQEGTNPPGRERITYRIGDFLDFRKELMRAIDKQPPLANWTTRDPADPGIAMLEGVAVLGDILTTYQESYANEAFLRTAADRNNLGDLIQLSGYRYAPPLSGSARFAFEVKGPDPVLIPKGCALKAELIGSEGSAYFEGESDLIGHADFNKLSLEAEQETPMIGAESHDFYVLQHAGGGSVPELKAGDRLVLGKPSVGESGELLEPRLVTIASVDSGLAQTRFKIKGQLGISPTNELTGYKIRKEFRHFGYQAPPTFVKGKDNQVVINFNRNIAAMSQKKEGISDNSTLNSNKNFDKKTSIENQYQITTIQATIVNNITPPFGNDFYPLEQEVSDLVIGETVLVNFRKSDVKQRMVLRKIEGLKATSLSMGNLTAASTCLTLSPLTSASDPQQVADLREIRFHLVEPEPLAIRAAWRPRTSGSGSKLVGLFSAEQAERLMGRELLLAKPNREPLLARVSAVEVIAPYSDLASVPRRISLDQTIDYGEWDSSELSIYANIVLASQGKSEGPIVLGSGNYHETFQTFPLPKGPLSWRYRPEKQPPESAEIRVFVNGREWQRVSSLYHAGPNDPCYLVLEHLGTTHVQFGDGSTGMRLPTGSNNVIAYYRVGAGAYGWLKAGASAQLGGPIEGVSKVHLPGEVTGGSGGESEARARKAAPQRTRWLERLVSAEDYQAIALKQPGVLRAKASFQADDARAGLLLVLLLESGREGELQQLRTNLRKLHQSQGMARVPLRVEAGSLRLVRLQASLGLDPRLEQEPILAQARAVLGPEQSLGLFGYESRQFGQPEQLNRVIALLQRVPGVIWVKVDHFLPLSGDKAQPLLQSYSQVALQDRINPKDTTTGSALKKSRQPAFSKTSNHSSHSPSTQPTATALTDQMQARGLYKTIACGPQEILALAQQGLSLSARTVSPDELG